MAQARKKTATKTARKTVAKKAGRKNYLRYERYDKKKEQKSNMVFVISMSFLAATLLFADLLMMVA